MTLKEEKNTLKDEGLIDNFIKNWYTYMDKGTVFYHLRCTLSNVRHLPDSGFKTIWKQLSQQIEKLSKYEFNENIQKYPNKTCYTDIGEVYKGDFSMIDKLINYLGSTWNELYTDKLVNDIKNYVKYYEKYIFKMF